MKVIFLEHIKEYFKKVKEDTANKISELATKTVEAIEEIENKKAEKEHKHSASDITSGTLPLTRGGTGATTASTSLNNLGGFSKNGGTISGDVTINGKVAEGTSTIASGEGSHAEGYETYARGGNSHTEGNLTEATSWNTHAEGYQTKATSNEAHAEGRYTTATAIGSHAEGEYTSASGAGSHAEGYASHAKGNFSHTEGHNNFNYGLNSHSEGGGTVVTRTGSHTEGLQTIAGFFVGEVLKIKSYDSATKKMTFDTAYQDYSTAFSKLKIGNDIIAQSQKYSNTAYIFTVESINTAGNSITISGWDTDFTAGRYAVLIDTSDAGASVSAHAEGQGTMALNWHTHAQNYCTIADRDCQTAMGKYNKANSNGLLVIGNGSSETNRSNCFRVQETGGIFANASYNSTGADYAEYFQWEDDNPKQEDRIGLFVTLDKDKIRLADSNDDYILGIISGNPSVVGDSYNDDWNGKYETDIYSRPILEEVQIPERKEIFYHEDGTKEEIIMEKPRTEIRQKLNPDYDSTQEYIPRSERSEWAVVGMMGKLVVIDDGSCKVNGWCKAGEGGIATKSEKQTKFRVMKRLDKTHIKVLVL